MLSLPSMVSIILFSRWQLYSQDISPIRLIVLYLPLQNEVLAVATNPHNDLCGMLTAELSKLKGSAATADARLTVLANWMEEQVSVRA